MSMARGVTTCNNCDQEKMKIATMRIATIHRLIVKRKREEKKAAKQANAQFDAKSPYEKIAEVYQVPLELDFWPMDGMRWQSKNVALECLQNCCFLHGYLNFQRNILTSMQ